MEKPKIISLGYAVPQYSYGQETIFKTLSYPRHFWRIYRDAGIQKRHFCIPLERIRQLSFQAQQETYREEAVRLSKQATINCLDGRDPKEIGCLVYCSCTGFGDPGPTVGHYLIRELGLRQDILIKSIRAQGCEGGGFPGLGTAVDFTVAHQQPSLVVACELPSLTYYPEPDGKPDPENDWELLRANAIFADLASAALVGLDHDLKHPFILDSEAFTDTAYLDDLGYTWRNGRLRVLLSKRVPIAARDVTEKAVRKLLTRHKLEVEDINYWVVHAAGMRVIDLIRNTLGIAEEKLKFSKEFLKNYGNTSSATVGGVAKMLIQQVAPQYGEYLMVITVGPGVTGGASLLQFGD